MSDNTDDLEQTLMLAAAAADSRQYEDEENTNQSPEPEYSSTNEEIHYYTPAETTDESRHKSLKITSSPSCVTVDPEVDNVLFPSYKSKTIKRRNDLVSESSSKKVRTEYDANNQSDNKGIKRKHEDSDSSSKFKSETFISEEGNHAQVVATHYNLIEEKGLDERSKSRLVYMRSFHNWIKSMLINEYLTKIKDSKKQHNPPIRVHDMCCGKGGDLSKWKKGNISHLICTDNADISLEHCKQRYAEMKQRSKNERGRNAGNLFTMEVHHGDLGRVRIREKFTDPSMKLDLVSCQFAFHYTFESLPQAECMMKNASECLLPGGYFIGTMPDSNEIMARARKSETGSFKNDVLEVSLEFDLNKPPLFGGKYNFQLEGVVNCPEFLVHFPTFVKLAKKYGLKLVKTEKFGKFFERMKDEGRQLLGNMRALESYPANEETPLAGCAPNDYTHAQEFVHKLDIDQVKIGTLSRSEWEVTSLYFTFAFEKVKNTWNADGTPCYDI